MPVLVFVRQFEVRKTRNNDTYASLRLSLGAPSDFAEVDGKIWSLDQLCKGGPYPCVLDILEIDYTAEDYQGKPQWVIKKFRRLEGAEREAALAQFTPQRKIDFDFYQERLDELINQTSPERVSGMLLRHFFGNESFRAAFVHAPAARDFHQNYPGGLLEHTINVISLALALADSYAAPQRPGLTFNRQQIPIDRQALIAGGLLHDIGKIETYKFEPLPELTAANTWEGHLSIGYAIVRGVTQSFLQQPPYAGAEHEVSKILHMMLAHHGSMEFGSPVEPACAEAFLLAQADMTDARIAEICEAGHRALATNPAAQWLPRNLHFKGGVFIGDWANLK